MKLKTLALTAVASTLLAGAPAMAQDDPATATAAPTAATDDAGDDGFPWGMLGLLGLAGLLGLKRRDDRDRPAATAGRR